MLILKTVLIHLLSFKIIDYSSNPIPIFATLQPDVLDDFQLANLKIRAWAIVEFFYWNNLEEIYNLRIWIFWHTLHGLFFLALIVS